MSFKSCNLKSPAPACLPLASASHEDASALREEGSGSHKEPADTTGLQRRERGPTQGYLSLCHISWATGKSSDSWTPPCCLLPGWAQALPLGPPEVTRHAETTHLCRMLFLVKHASPWMQTGHDTPADQSQCN